MKTIRTNDFLNDDIWKNQLEKYGNGYNKNLSNCPFHTMKKKIYSQSGEEGIIGHIFNMIGYSNKWCLEMGAGDGVGISNTYHFYKKYNFKRLLIEGDLNNIKNKRTRENIIHAIVTSQNINGLMEQLPETYDFLSLDLDGDDYWVWKSMKKKARVVILEFHPGIPNDVPLVCKEGQGTVESHEGSSWNVRDKPIHNPNLRTLNGYYGANLLAFYRLAKEKGYKFVTTLSDNAIFVLDEEFHKLNIEEINEEQLINNYFSPASYWGEKHRDMYNSEWIIPE